MILRGAWCVDRPDCVAEAMVIIVHRNKSLSRYVSSCASGRSSFGACEGFDLREYELNQDD